MFARAYVWLFVPAGASRDVIDRLNEELGRTPAISELVKGLPEVTVASRHVGGALGRIAKSETIGFGKFIMGAASSRSEIFKGE